MSTNATIIEKTFNDLGDEIYRAIYLHWDGYPSHAFEQLKEGYSTPEEVEELINLGDCSEIYVERERCKFYNRDKGQPWDEVKPEVSQDLSELLSFYGNTFNYLFEDGNWRVI